MGNNKHDLIDEQLVLIHLLAHNNVKVFPNVDIQINAANGLNEKEWRITGATAENSTPKP